MKVCKYCGAILNKGWYKGDICGGCRQKQPLVKELVAICQEIKKYKENRNGTSEIG